jgi:DNA polymerase III psi subunit
MNSKAIFSLSDYQRATLTAMGISAWRQHENPSSVVEQESIISVDIKSKNEEIVESEIVGSNPSTLVRQSLPEHVLFPEHLAAHPMFVDILRAMGLQEKPRRAIVDSNEVQYSDYLLIWQVADKIALHGTTLTTSDLTTLSSAKAKKQLWQTLQSYNQQNRTA